MYHIHLNAVSKVVRNTVNVKIKKGDHIEVLMNDAGYAALATNNSIRFSPNDFEVFIPEEVFNKLLGVC